MTELVPRTHAGQAGAYGLQGGIPPELGSGVRVDDFTPPSSLQMAYTMDMSNSEGTSGATALYGTPLTHFAQQREAFWYAQEHRGFGNEPVTFMCHWQYMAPTLFTATNNGWIQAG